MAVHCYSELSNRRIKRDSRSKGHFEALCDILSTHISFRSYQTCDARLLARLEVIAALQAILNSPNWRDFPNEYSEQNRTVAAGYGNSKQRGLSEQDYPDLDHLGMTLPIN